MALVLKDRIRETTTTTGTGTITLAGAVTGFRSFADIGNANTTYYTIVGGTEWEVGIGTYTLSGTTLARTTVLSNSLGTTAAINFSAGTKDVFVSYPAGKSIYQDQNGYVGVGTTSPSYNFEVVSTEATARTRSTTSGNSSVNIMATPTDSMYVGKDRNGSSGWYGSSGEYIIACTGAYPLDIYTNNTKQLSITSAGGISTGSTGTNYGTSGQVLTSNGNAPPSWTTANAASAGGVIYENSTTISSNYTMTSGKNGFSVGTITIASGVTVTVPSGQRWVVM